jgi:bifunctional UDP-N-acetylglucosamine pyrophosphorylase/glucosamine-1-phosphate N-acetyltransferase
VTHYRHPDVVGLVLAAGQGKRMQSDLPKVLHQMAGRPLLGHVFQMLEDLGVGRVIAVIGYQRDRVRETFPDAGVEWAIQAEQRGTGHAVLCAAPALEGFEGTLLVVCGDTPLLTAKTHHELLESHRASGAAVTVLTMTLPDPTGYGRIVRGPDGGIERIVEERDASPEMRAIAEVNSGIYAFDYAKLVTVLSRLTAQNSQGEYYLTDTVTLLERDGHRAEAVLAPDYRELIGINTLEQLGEAEALYHAMHGGAAPRTS